MDFAVVKITKGNGKFVAYLATQCSRLSKAKMMSMAGLAPADQTGKASHVAQMARVTKPLDLAAKQLAFIDPFALLRCGPRPPQMDQYWAREASRAVRLKQFHRQSWIRPPH